MNKVFKGDREANNRYLSRADLDHSGGGSKVASHPNPFPGHDDHSFSGADGYGLRLDRERVRLI